MKVLPLHISQYLDSQLYIITQSGKEHHFKILLSQGLHYFLNLLFKFCYKICFCIAICAFGKGSNDQHEPGVIKLHQTQYIHIICGAPSARSLISFLVYVQ